MTDSPFVRTSEVTAEHEIRLQALQLRGLAKDVKDVRLDQIAETMEALCTVYRLAKIDGRKYNPLFESSAVGKAIRRMEQSLYEHPRRAPEERDAE